MIQIGSVIDGFKIYEIKNGGMANVYKGNNADGFKKAFKAVRPDKVTDNPQICRYFLEEIQTMQKLDHPNIVKIDRVITYDNQTLLEMECLEGDDLSGFIKRNFPDGIKDTERLKRISLQVLKALSYAHSNNYLHNDIKPSNIFYTNSGYLKLLDFGIARVVGAHAEKIKGATQVTVLTTTGESTFKGSLAYASPEQQAGKELGVTSDIFSFGKTLHFIATGSEDMDDDVPDELFAEVVKKCTQQKRSDRFQSCQEVINYINNPPELSKVCPKCEFKVSAKDRFCPRCGCEIASEQKKRSCYKCKTVINKGLRFCPNCGTEQKKGAICGNKQCLKYDVFISEESLYYGKYCTSCGKQMNQYE